MKGKWAKGIAPRFFAWIIKDQLAVSERPGGYARNHRRVRRQEEILWLRGEGFTRVISLLTSPHNLHAYDELDMAWAHIPFGPHDDPHVVLPDLYAQLREWITAGERLLVHHEELSDRLMGVVAGYLRWSGLVPAGPQAISVVERIMHRQMGPDGRELVAMALQLAGAGGCPGTVRVRARTSEEFPARVRQSLSARAVALDAAPPTRVDLVALDGVDQATTNGTRRPEEAADAAAGAEATGETETAPTDRTESEPVESAPGHALDAAPGESEGAAPDQTLVADPAQAEGAAPVEVVVAQGEPETAVPREMADGALDAAVDAVRSDRAEPLPGGAQGAAPGEMADGALDAAVDAVRSALVEPLPGGAEDAVPGEMADGALDAAVDAAPGDRADSLPGGSEDAAPREMATDFPDDAAYTEPPYLDAALTDEATTEDAAVGADALVGSDRSGDGEPHHV